MSDIPPRHRQTAIKNYNADVAVVKPIAAWSQSQMCTINPFVTFYDKKGKGVVLFFVPNTPQFNQKSWICKISHLFSTCYMCLENESLPSLFIGSSARIDWCHFIKNIFLPPPPFKVLCEWINQSRLWVAAPVICGGTWLPAPITALGEKTNFPVNSSRLQKCNLSGKYVQTRAELCAWRNDVLNLLWHIKLKLCRMCQAAY
jgi:hypothetical protein